MPGPCYGNMLFKFMSFARLTSKNWLIIIASGNCRLDVVTGKGAWKDKGGANGDTSRIVIDSLHVC